MAASPRPRRSAAPPSRAARLALLSLLPLAARAFAPSPLTGPRPFVLAASSAEVDPVTYLRTEWVAAALVTNQTPREADVVLQLGCEDGRIVNFVPRTVREIISSSAEGPGAGLTLQCSRQLKQQAERRRSGVDITYSDQPADDLVDTPSASVDIVVSLLAARRMAANGMDWRRGVREAARVLRPGGRFLFVESSEVEPGVGYLDYLRELSDVELRGGDGDGWTVAPADADAADAAAGAASAVAAAAPGGDAAGAPVFEEVGYDDVDLVLQPHIAGVAVKALDADLSTQEKAARAAQEERDLLADRSLVAFERGNKRRKRRKKKKAVDGMGREVPGGEGQ